MMTSTFPRPVFAVIDTETTGLDPSCDRIVELAAVLFDDNFHEIDRWHSLIHPGATPVTNSHIHGITSQVLAHAPNFGAVYRSFATFCDGAILLAHNAPFDKAMIESELWRVRPGNDVAVVPCVDTIDIAKHALPQAQSYSLTNLLDLLGVENNHAHTAVSDAAATGAMIRALFKNNTPAIARRIYHQATPFDCLHAIEWGLAFHAPAGR